MTGPSSPFEPRCDKTTGHAHTDVCRQGIAPLHPALHISGLSMFVQPGITFDIILEALYCCGMIGSFRCSDTQALYEGGGP